MLWTQLKNLVIANTLDDRSADLLPLSTLLSAAKKHCHAGQAHWNPFSLTRPWNNKSQPGICWFTDFNLTVLTVLTVRVFCSWAKFSYGQAHSRDRRSWPYLAARMVCAVSMVSCYGLQKPGLTVDASYRLQLVFSIRRINIDTRLPL